MLFPLEPVVEQVVGESVSEAEEVSARLVVPQILEEKSSHADC